MLRLLAVAALVAVLPFADSNSSSEVPVGAYRYRVTHPTYGDIGTFTNTIRRIGQEITVLTQVRIKVEIAFVTVRRIEADREEVWRGGLLMAYRSVTNRDGKTIKVQGRAERDKFIIDGTYCQSALDRDPGSACKRGSDAILVVPLTGTDDASLE